MKFGVLSGVNRARQKVIEVKVRKQLCTDEKEDPKSVFSFHFLPKAILIIRLREKKRIVWCCKHLVGMVKFLNQLTSI